MSPIAKYFKGEGNKVMADMQDRYGDDKGKKVFYATANSKPDMKPADNPRPEKRKSFGQKIGSSE